jgi:hypothetical protein
LTIGARTGYALRWYFLVAVEPMDPLSEVLAPLSSQNAFFGGLKAGGDWAVHFPALQGGKFNAVVRGGCWLAAEGLAAPLRLEAGDCPQSAGNHRQRSVAAGARCRRALFSGEKRRGDLRRGGDVFVYRRPVCLRRGG